MIVVNGVKNGRASLTETISRSFERRGGSQGKHGQEWPRCAPVLWRPLYSIHGSQRLLQGLYYPIMCVCQFFVSVKTSEQRQSYCMRPWEWLRASCHTQTHISKCRQISHAFFLPFRLLLLLLFCLLFSPVSLVVGKVLIGLFPKLFLIKDKQGIHISLGDVGLPKVSCSLLQFSLCSREALNGRDEARDVSTRAVLHKGGLGPAGV